VFEKGSAWLKRHKKEVAFAIVGLVAAGMVLILIVNGRKVSIPIKETTEQIIPRTTGAEQQAQTITKVLTQTTNGMSDTMENAVADVIAKTFPRAGGIRNLPSGQKASVAKLLQAAEKGINLEPGQTLVNDCIVTRIAA